MVCLLGVHGVVLWLLLQVVAISRSHVVLTFPPARRYALDFLDNERLPHSMCGMPQGLGPRTSLLAGTTINVTWNLAYPHNGGYKLEILDSLERPVMDLTPMIKNSRFISYNKFAQNHEITLPKDFECKNCSIRLLREVTEMGPDFLIRSCADVDILKNGYKEDCMGNGIFQHGKCNCRIPFVGHRCQFENECGDNSDCGEHGRCLLIDLTNYPKKQCFCELGWFGNQCKKESILKSKTLILESHNRQDLGHGIKLYWQILNDSEEIEIVILAKTHSYVAIGWRPNDIGAECKRHPNLDFSTSAKSEIRKGKDLSLTESPTLMQYHNTSTTETFKVAETATVSVQSVKETTPTSVVSNTKSLNDITTDSRKLTSVVNSPNVRFPTRRTNLSRRFPAKFLTSRTTTQATMTKTEPTTSSTTTAATSEMPLNLQTETNVLSETTMVVFEVRSESSIQNDETQEVASTNEEKTSSEDRSSKSLEEVDDDIPSDEQISAYSKKPVSTISDMDTAASEETVSNVQVKSYGPDVGKSKREVNHEIRIEESPYYSTLPLHSMDCTDMVIGAVRDDYSRISDYYSRDMSSPHMDSFWGGTDDLTAAMGFESNGASVIMFRKKLTTQENTDHNITDSLMHVIWAMGQTENKNAESSDSFEHFYEPDALQYHGDRGQRGTTAINFYADAVRQNTSTKPVCRGEWKLPSKCTLDDCEYKTTWEYENETDDISFTIFTNHTNTWTGIGFSNDAKMNNSDAIIGWVNDNGKHFMMDMWISGYAAPILDSKQDIESERGQRNKSGTTLMFKRKRNTGDPNDLAFTKSECLYLIFPYHGGTYNSVNKKIQMHTRVPAISSKRICMTECEDMHDVKSETPDAFLNVETKYTTSTEFMSSTVTTEPALTLIIRLPLEDAVFTDNEEIQNAAKKKIQSEVHSVLKDLHGYENVVVSNVSRDPNVTNWLLAAMKIQVNTYMESQNESSIESVIRSYVAEGKIGSLRVDPNYIHLQVPEGWAQTTTIGSTSVQEVAAASSDLIAIYAIIIAVCILGLLIIIQIICNICSYMKTKNTRISKEKLFANSGWKDYSITASSNYSYEPFSSSNHEDSTGKVSTHPVGGNHSGSSKYRADHRSNPHRNSPGDAPSLLQSQSSHDNGKGHYSRRSESLPHPNAPSAQAALRGSNYATHNRALRNNTPKAAVELQPDFYFMPSQRRYKGEVVRVYVDYNNPN